SNAEIINALESIVLPGLIDPHVHLREPGFEWKETIQSGALAAVLGGFTTVFCMPNTNPVNDNAEITKFIIEKAEKTGAAKVLPIGAVSLGLKGEELAPLAELREAGCVAFSDDGEPIYNANIMRRALEWCKALGARVCCHEEDKTLTAGGSMNESALSYFLGLKGMPPSAEEIMIARDIELARSSGGAVHICHLSTKRGVELIKRAKEDGINITAEVTPHHLLLTEERVKDYDTNAKMSPPLRREEDREALLEGLKTGVIDVVASDHAPHERDAKLLEFSKAPFGIIGLQTTAGLIFKLVDEGKLSFERAVKAMSTKVAEIFNIDGGTIKKGAPADITIINLKERWRLKEEDIVSLSKNTPFLGEEMLGQVENVIVNGRIVLKNRKLLLKDIEEKSLKENKEIFINQNI
ncbi:MAG: dihydroorotase, partial [Candidatus Dadabacteria bacterium]